MPNERAVTFTVKGRVPFPVDMLRYDACFPSRTEDANTIADSLMRQGESREYEVELVSYTARGVPTRARWDSFLWKVL